ncbi:MAG: amidase [Hellea sp.]|nr:amidase [Hellea sp.]
MIKFNRKHYLTSAAFALTLIVSCAEKSTNLPEKNLSPSSDPILEQSLPELADALSSEQINSEQLVESYLRRIETQDHAGYKIQSILTINPDALEEAKLLDQLRENGKIMGPLHGVPVVLKDNIETKDNMPTTAGALALKDNFTGRDSPLAAGLREEGAIILGKTNLSQWANFRSNNSMSGWSALGGQTRNPHYLDRNPCGSSSGSAAAMAAEMAAGAVGTETNGSIICPSNVNGIVGFKPTVGLVSQQYIVPISSTQDTAGPMTRSVTGAAMMLAAMDNRDVDYVSALDAESLDGTRIGVLRFAQGSNPDIIQRFDQAIDDLEQIGAEIVEIADDAPDGENLGSKSFDLLKYEFKATLNDYLASTPDIVKVRSLSELIAYNEAHADVELALFGQDILEASDEKGPLTDEAYITARKDLLHGYQKGGLDRILEDYEVDVLISPSGPVAGRIDPINGDVWPAWAGAGRWAAIAGYPHLTVPMGQIDGMPIGLSFIGGKNMDAEILSYGYSYEQATQHYKRPEYRKSAESVDYLKDAMTRK